MASTMQSFTNTSASSVLLPGQSVSRTRMSLKENSVTFLSVIRFILTFGMFDGVFQLRFCRVRRLRLRRLGRQPERAFHRRDQIEGGTSTSNGE